MTIVADTSGLLAHFNRAEPLHDAATSIVLAADRIVVSPYVIAELGYIIGTRVGAEAEIEVIEELASGAYDLAAMGPSELREAVAIMRRFSDQPIGVTDASVVVLADRAATDRLLTLDHRHFSVIRSAAGAPFELLP